MLKKYVLNIAKFLVFISLGIFIFWKVYKGQDIDELLSAMHQVDFVWVYLSMALGLLSHIARSARWVLMARSMGYKPSGYNSFFAVMILYFANYAFPRMGEVTRCAVIKRYEKIPLTTSLGTIISERIIDVIILLVLTVITVLSQLDFFTKFINDNPAVSDNIKGIMNSGWLIGMFILIGIGFIVAYFFLYKKLERYKIVQKINDKLRSMRDGLFSIQKVEKQFLFWFYSFAIWALYYLMIYVCFFGFGFTSDFTALHALTLFLLGSYGMVAPVQGGIGAYHFMIIAGLVIYGIQDADARLFALIVHGAQTIMLIGFGFLSYLSIPVYNKYRNKKPQMEEPNTAI